MAQLLKGKTQNQKGKIYLIFAKPKQTLWTKVVLIMMLKLFSSDCIPGALLNRTTKPWASVIFSFHFFTERETEAYQVQRRSSWTPGSCQLVCTSLHKAMCMIMQNPKLQPKFPVGRGAENLSTQWLYKSECGLLGTSAVGVYLLEEPEWDMVSGSGSVSEWGTLNLTFKVKWYSNSWEDARWCGGLAPQG